MKLSPSALAHLHIVYALIQQKETELAALKGHVSSLIREDVGVDINKGSWSLSLETGEVSHVDPSENPPPTIEEGVKVDA